MAAPGFLLTVFIALVCMTGIITLFLMLNRASYQRYLDKRVAEHSLGKKDVKAFSPLRTALIVLLGSFLAIFLTILILEMITQARLAHDDEVVDGVFAKPCMGNVPALEGHTGQDELPGYHRYTAFNGYDTLVYYIAAEPNEVSPQILFWLDTDLPRFKYDVSLDIDRNNRNRASWDVVGDLYKWGTISFPFNFSQEKEYLAGLTITVNGEEMLLLSLNEIARGEAAQPFTPQSLYEQ